MGQVWGYARVSTDRQENSVANQQERIKEYVAKEGLVLAGIFVDEDVTGRMPMRLRPNGRKLWDAMNNGDTVVFNKVDRVFRSVCDAANTLRNWLDKGVRCVILDLGIDLSTPAGRMFFHQLASFAEFESALIGQRTRETAAYLRQQGRPFGSARPFGWLRKGKGFASRYEPLESEREVAHLARKMHAEGHSFRQIAWHLMQNRITKPGKTPSDRKKGVWYCVSDVHALCHAARLGFPICPRAALLSSAMPETQTVCSD
jgi:DNA invertase Pin-like site-specific DNA recombinase